MSSGPENEEGKTAKSSEGTVLFRPLSRAEASVVLGLSLVQGGILGWAAVTLPWTLKTPFAVLCAAVAFAQWGCAGACATGLLKADASGEGAGKLPRIAGGLWRASGLLSLVLFAFCAWMVLSTSSYLVGLYGKLGEGFSAVLLAILGLAGLLTVPTACWALCRTRGLKPSLRGGLKGLAGLGVVFVLVGASAFSETRPQAERQPLDHAELTELASVKPLGSVSGAEPLSKSRAVRCKQDVQKHFTLVLSHRPPGAKRAHSVCLQAESRAELLSSAASRVKKLKPEGYLKLDLVTAVSVTTREGSLLEALALRPGLDGACAGERCLMPWQLLSRGEFLKHRPLDFLQDLRFGVSFKRLRKLLKAPDDSELLRIQTQSVVVSPEGELTTLRRMRAVGPLLSKENVESATRAAQRHILSAQDDKGKFRYTLDPFTGKASSRDFNLPRQAGTALVLCELGRKDDGEGAALDIELGIQRALQLLVDHERASADGTLGALSKQKNPTTVRLGPSALTLAALATCRERVGAQFDAALVRLTHLVMEMQRDNGGFFPNYRLRAQKGKAPGVIDGSEPLYAPGQAILALVVLEDWARRAEQGKAPAIEGLPSREALGERVERAMKYIATRHWDHALYDFFFVEENWHCLAARAALPVHPNPAYEQFCFDYIRFKSRLILERDSDVEPEFVGGFGFGNVIPPHNTGAAGFAEALSAAVAVKLARQEPVDEERALLRSVMEFLLRQQWMDRNGFAVKRNALGALSEHTHSPVVRIDFVQHAWAGLGHGNEVLTWDGT